MILRASLAVAIVLAAAFAPPAQASPPASAPADLAAAIVAIDAVARETKAKGEMPRLSDPRAAQALERLWDREKLLGAPPYVTKDVRYLLDLLEKSNTLFKAYLFFTPDPSKPAQSDRNNFVFQNETSRAQAFILATSAAIAPALTDFVATAKPGDLTEARKNGLRQTRLGVLQMVTGAALTMRSPAYSPENQERLSAALAEAATPFASMSPAPDRKALSAAAESALAAATPEAKKNLEAFIAAMSEAPCEALCRLD